MAWWANPPICCRPAASKKLPGTGYPSCCWVKAELARKLLREPSTVPSLSGQFVPIDCGSLVGSLMESELFGHTKGSFSGATENKKGLVELADGGTAFLMKSAICRLKCKSSS